MAHSSMSHSVNKATTYVLASQLLASLVNTVAKHLESDSTNSVKPLQILHARMFVTAVLCSLALFKLSKDDFKDSYSFPSTYRLRALLATRAIAGACGVIGFHYSLMHLSLTEATSLNLLAPLMACCILNFIDNTPFKIGETLSILTSFLGTLAIVKPTFIFSPTAESGGESRVAGIAFALLGAAGGSVSYICVRKIGTDLHAILVVKCLTIGVLFVTSLIQLATITTPGVLKLKMGVAKWVMIISTGFAGFAMECLLCLGLSLDPTSRAMQAIYSQTILSLLVDVIVWKMPPDTLAISGCLVVLLSNIVLARTGRNKKAQLGNDQSGVDLPIR